MSGCNSCYCYSQYNQTECQEGKDKQWSQVCMCLYNKQQRLFGFHNCLSNEQVMCSINLDIRLIFLSSCILRVMLKRNPFVLPYYKGVLAK